MGNSKTLEARYFYIIYDIYDSWWAGAEFKNENPEPESGSKPKFFAISGSELGFKFSEIQDRGQISRTTGTGSGLPVHP